jgi:putative tricarboxylic transport membrane protein
MDAFVEALGLVFVPEVLLVLFLASVFGLFVGSIPGLTATMAVALLVPLTFFMDPVPAMGAVVATTAMAIFAGDIPGALLRIPGTPASAAYVEESHLLSTKGKLELALGANVICSAVGGLVGAVVFILAAPRLAEIALLFSSYEYFWLTVLGLSCAVIISRGSQVKGTIALIFGLFFSTVGLDVAMGYPRFSFGSVDLAAGISILPALIGSFAISEIIRKVTKTDLRGEIIQQEIGNLLRGVGGSLWRYKSNAVRGSILGTLIGALPGAGADMAAYISFAIGKKFSKEKEKYGTGHVEALVDSSSANNASVSGAWVPALVFGIPGDTLTAIVIGVLFMKGINPGPTVFINTPEFVYAIFIMFLLANICMVPLGIVAIKLSRYILSVPPNILFPMILLTCVIGTFAVHNSMFDIWIMLTLGIIAYLMEENEVPIAPMILGLLLGKLVEDNFMASIIKADGQFLEFFDRPMAAFLGILTITLWVLPAVFRIWRGLRSR